MVNAGASIEAFLKLDASGFKSGVKTATEAITNLKESMTALDKNFSKQTKALTSFMNALKSVGEESGVISQGMRSINNALNSLLPNLSILTEYTSEPTKFKNFAKGLLDIATAAQRMSVDAERGGVGIQNLTEVMKIWETGVASAEIKVTGLASAMRTLVASSTSVSSDLITQDSATKNLANSINLMSTSTAEGRQNLALYHQNLKALALGVEEFNSIEATADGYVKRFTTSVNMAKATLIDLNTVFQRASTSINMEKASLIDLWNVYDRGNTIMRTLNASSQALSSESERRRVINQSLITGEEQFFKSIEEVNTAIRRNSQEMMQNAEAKLRAMGYTGELSTKEKILKTDTDQATNSMQRFSSASRSATSSTQAQTTATNGLSKAMSSLRMIGSLVASMMVWNFASSLINATRETVNAKSEMEGYFQMLHFSQSEIKDFNNALEDTVNKFQRINKYALGETISSIGVEFNLSTQEMKKAMPVVSMITSEYLRAGRNVNEASLAVKDILQGEFQRLSRETGVKGDQLKEAGWSGDKNDIMGLLEALDKVGKSRNWDVFVTKANSLNDAVLILQNRFSEWTADMFYAVQPTIVRVFNMLMGTAEKFASVMDGVGKWLNSDGLAQSIVKWGGLATAIGLVTTALISYRTGAGILQIAQMGLTKSIASTVLGLQAETVATYGTGTAIASKIFGLEAEKVATISVKDAILSKVLGLDAELVAQTSLKQGIIDKAFAQELETMRLRGATAEELRNTLAVYENELSQKSSLGIISARALGLNMTTYATHGFTVALLENTTQMKASEIASMGLGKKMLLLGASVGVPLAIVGAFAVALGLLALKMNDSAKQMERFNKILKDGASIVQENKDKVQEYTEKQDALKKKLAETKEGTVEYRRVQDELRATNQDLKTSTDNLKASYEAYQKVVSADKKFNDKLTDIALDKQQRLAKAYQEAGYNEHEALEMVNQDLIDANNGAEQLRLTLQKIAVLSYKGEQNTMYILGTLDDAEVDPQITKKYIEKAEDINDAMQKAMIKGMTDDSFMGRIDGWLNYYTLQVENWINNISAMAETGDWGQIGGTIALGILHGFADLPYIKDFWNWVFTSTGITKYAGQGEDGLDAIVHDIFNFFRDTIMDFIEPNPLFDIIEEWINGDHSIKDLLENSPSSLLTDLLKGWVDDAFTTDFNVDEMLQTTIIEPLSYLGDRIMECLQNIATYDYIGEFLKTWGLDFDWNEALTQMLSGISNFDLIGWANQSFIIPLSNAFYNGIIGIPIISDILQLLGLVPQQNQNAYNTGYNLIDHLKQGVEQKISEIPIIGDIARMLGLIPQQNQNANAKGHGVGENIKKGEADGHRGMADNVRTEMDNVITAISKKFGEAYQVAHDIGNQILNGIKDALDMHSPSIISRELIANEFGVYIPNAISSSGDLAYSTAQEYATKMYDGMNSVNSGFGLGGVVDEYQTDAQTVATYSQMMGTDTTTAFNDMSLAVNDTTTQMGTNVTTTYSTIQSKQASLLNNMKSSNTTAYQQMVTQSNTSLTQMRDSTSNLTNQMTNAWIHMKDSIVATANNLRSETTTHFNTLSDHIGSFYRKIQNPSNWGAGAKTPQTRGARNSKVGKSFVNTVSGGKKYAGGTTGRYSPYMGKNTTMSLRQLKQMICPNGDCNIFDGYDLSSQVNVYDFLNGLSGDFGFGWNGWNRTHYNYIKDKSDEWKMKSPVLQIMGGIPTDADFKVGEFNSGQPKISFGAFQSMAESLFRTVPYAFYYNSDKYGSWQNALAHGECNCWDGANALIAFANTCGFDGYIAHGTWDGIAHVWAVINGQKMDTTGMQQRGTWTPSASAGSPPNGSVGNTVVNVTIDMTNSNIYGIDDLESKIENGVSKGLQKQFNQSVTVRI